MTNNDDKRPPPPPWCTGFGLARLLCALVLGLGGFLWSVWLLVTGRGEESMLLMLVTWACARFLAGSLNGYKG